MTRDIIYIDCPSLTPAQIKTLSDYLICPPVCDDWKVVNLIGYSNTNPEVLDSLKKVILDAPTHWTKFEYLDELPAGESYWNKDNE